MPCDIYRLTLNTIAQDDIGHVLAHTATSPEYSDYVDLKAKDGDFDIKIMDLEGPCFETEGVLEALVQQVSREPACLCCLCTSVVFV